MSKPIVTVLRINSEGLFIVNATDDIAGRAFTVAMREEPDHYLTTIRGLALLQLDHVIIDERAKP
jgi:hypothetical protein